MKEEESVALQGCAEGSFKQIFWQQQKQAASRRVFNGTFS
jgi:hypothetical protein